MKRLVLGLAGLVVFLVNLGLANADYTFTTISVPGASFTEAFGINDAGQIVGQYQDVNKIIHGFLATPVPEPASHTLLGIGAVCSLGYGWRRRRVW